MLVKLDASKLINLNCIQYKFPRIFSLNCVLLQVYIFGLLCSLLNALRRFWATICKTVRPMLSDRFLSCSSCLCVTLVDCIAKRLDGFATWYGGRPRPMASLCYMGTQLPHKGHSRPIFGPCLLWPNGLPSQLLLSSF